MNMKKRDNIAGAIYGFAIGDAMGATTEFMDEKEINRKFGKVSDIIGGGWLRLKAGDVTDDTQMTICVMDALIKSPYESVEFIEYCKKNFVEWFKRGPKDVGAQCAKGIYSIVMGKSLEVDDKALGNGSLMRAMPCALIDNVPFNIRQGKLTHNNVVCSRMILYYSRLINSYINSNYTINTVNKLMEPTGCVKNTLNNAIYWSNKDSFRNAILGAVNHGGDADTIAAITGSLAGAKFGYDNIPKRWVNQLNPNIRMYLEAFKNFVFSYLQI